MSGAANKLDQAVAELREWEAETGQRLPYAAEAIALGEAVGVACDLFTGYPVDDGGEMDETDGREASWQKWLADLELACGGSVTVTWAMTPEAYFAAVERGEL